MNLTQPFSSWGFIYWAFMLIQFYFLFSGDQEFS